MEISGTDDVLLTTADSRHVICQALPALFQIWPKPVFEVGKEINSQFSRFVNGKCPAISDMPAEGYLMASRDDMMLEEWNKSGYFVSTDRTGPFSIVYDRVGPVRYRLPMIEEVSEGRHAPPPYDAWLCCAAINRITFVCGGDTKDQNEFFGRVYWKLCECASNAPSPIVQAVPDGERP